MWPKRRLKSTFIAVLSTLIPGALVLMITYHLTFSSQNSSKPEHGKLTNSTLNLGKIYVVSASSDRAIYMKQILEYVKLDYELFSGFTTEVPLIRSLVDQVVAWRNTQSSTARNWARDASDLQIAGRIGCTASHIAIWKDMLRSNIQTALIMEDDIDMDIRIAETLTNAMKEIPTDWEILFPGYCSSNWFPDRVKEPPSKEKIIQQLSRAACGHGYIMSLRAAKILLGRPEMTEPNYETPWDVHMAHLIADGVIKSAYGFTPPIIVQRPRSLIRQSLVAPLESSEQPPTDIEDRVDVVDNTVERGWRYRDRLIKDTSAAYLAGVSYWHDLE